MVVREQICKKDSVMVKVNLTLICCMFECVCLCMCVVWVLAELTPAQVRGSVSR